MLRYNDWANDTECITWIILQRCWGEFNLTLTSSLSFDFVYLLPDSKFQCWRTKMKCVTSSFTSKAITQTWANTMYVFFGTGLIWTTVIAQVKRKETLSASSLRLPFLRRQRRWWDVVPASHQVSPWESTLRPTASVKRRARRTRWTRRTRKDARASTTANFREPDAASPSSTVRSWIANKNTTAKTLNKLRFKKATLILFA